MKTEFAGRLLGGTTRAAGTVRREERSAWLKSAQPGAGRVCSRQHGTWGRTAAKELMPHASAPAYRPPTPHKVKVRVLSLGFLPAFHLQEKPLHPPHSAPQTPICGVTLLLSCGPARFWGPRSRRREGASHQRSVADAGSSPRERLLPRILRVGGADTWGVGCQPGLAWRSLAIRPALRVSGTPGVIRLCRAPIGARETNAAECPEVNLATSSGRVCRRSRGASPLRPWSQATASMPPAGRSEEFPENASDSRHGENHDGDCGGSLQVVL